MLTSIARRCSVLTAVILFLLSSAPAWAQYFGQNRVAYKRLDFQILKTEHFDIYYYPEEREGIEIAARMAERWHARLQQLLDHQLRGRQPLVMFASHTDFEQNNIVPEAVGEGTGGVTEPIRRRIVLPFGGPLADTDHVIGHELVHAFQFDITTSPDAPPGQNGAERLPLWFIEGMAEYLSLGPVDANTAMWMRDAARQEKLPDIKDLNNPRYFPYRWGQAFWAYVGGRFGDDVVGRMLSLAAITDVETAIQRVLGVSEKDLSADWQAAIRRTYEPEQKSTTPPAQVGRPVIMTGGFGDLNVGPSLSPDGRRLAFLSSRGVFSLDLYVADAQSGRILHKLTSTATDPHYTSLQFIYSAGAWDNASRQLAVATVASGKPALAIFDAEKGDHVRDIPINDLDEILNPTWAPDGHAIAFSGMRGGLTDLYIYDLTANMLRRVTSDAFADMQPAWSPDGHRIAFVTDRFSSNLDTLAIGAFRIGMVDVATGRIEQVTPFLSGKNINPQWSADSRSLFFLSDRDGISNLYRLTLRDGAAGDVVQLTNITTGVSGITSGSPAMSVAAQSGLAAFSVYDNGKYAIHTIDARAEGRALADSTAVGAMLPPTDRKSSPVATVLADAQQGLPAPTAATETVPYNAKLHLEGVAQPSIAVGASRFGAALGGGVALAFSDTLRNHFLTTALQFNSGISGSLSAKDIGAQVAYINQARRWNWGVVGGQVPYLSGGFQTGLANINGQIVGVDQEIIFRQTERSATGLVAYPLNRARRVEFQGGLTQVAFDQVVRTTTFDPITGAVLDTRSDTTALGDTLSLGTTSAAFVSDSSTFGATSPVAGERYRLEVDPTWGSVNFTSVLADYRRYFMPFSFYTIAGRVMHYGRYGSGGEDQRLVPLYIGYQTLVRGYDVNSFDQADCVATTISACPAFDRLLGSRMLVGNLEFRFPLLRPFGASQNMYGPIPVEVALFTDGGVAWGRGDKPSIFGGDRHGVGSAGVALRVNLLGYAVGEFDFSRPFQRPGQGWVFQFNLMPGF